MLAQRSDVYRAARKLEAASVDVRGAQAQRFPRLTLNGSIGAIRFVAGKHRNQRKRGDNHSHPGFVGRIGGCGLLRYRSRPIEMTMLATGMGMRP